MSAFVVVRSVRASPPRLWQVLTDFAGYRRWLPLTSMRLDPGAPGVGWSFAGLTGVGRFRFGDSMTLRVWRPPAGTDPGVFEVVKTGRVLGGWARVEVAPGPGVGHSTVTWTEEIWVRPGWLGRRLAPVSDPVNRRLFARALDLMVAAAQRPDETDG